MSTQAVLLTGGASRRMGVDKATLQVRGRSFAEHIAGELLQAHCPVTVLGSQPLADCAWQMDAEAYQGPLHALAGWRPTAEHVFVASCDMPLFDGAIVAVLTALLGEDDAAIPQVEGRTQPLCALYRASCWPSLTHLVDQGERRVFAWLDGLHARIVTEPEWGASGIDKRALQGVNTPEELARLLGD